MQPTVVVAVGLKLFSSLWHPQPHSELLIFEDLKHQFYPFVLEHSPLYVESSPLMFRGPENNDR